MDEVIFNIRCLRYYKSMVFNEEVAPAGWRMAPQDRVAKNINQDLFCGGTKIGMKTCGYKKLGDDPLTLIAGNISIAR